jgi:hypothetical protein
MFDMHITKSYWGYASLTNAYLINKIPSRVLDSKHLLTCYPHHSLLPKLSPQRRLVAFFLFTLMAQLEVNWILLPSNLSLWVILLLKMGINVIIPHQ